MARAPGGAAWLGAFARHWRDRHWPRRAAASHRNPSRLVAARETGRRRPAGIARRPRLEWRAARRSDWLALSACWIACSASSVGSGDFCGIFAISNVASSLRRTVAARTVTLRGPRHERGNCRSRLAPSPLHTAGGPSYRLGITKETAPSRTFLSSLTSY